MNLKERGITVGDLIIIILIIFTTTYFAKSFNKDKKTSLNQEIISLENFYYRNIN